MCKRLAVGDPKPIANGEPMPTIGSSNAQVVYPSQREMTRTIIIGTIALKAGL
jgi:hypothetical protein